MIYVKSCPKCFGAVALEIDAYGPYFNCLNCGHQRDLVIAAPDPLKDRRVNPSRRIEAAQGARVKGDHKRVVVLT